MFWVGNLARYEDKNLVWNLHVSMKKYVKTVFEESAEMFGEFEEKRGPLSIFYMISGLHKALKI